MTRLTCLHKSPLIVATLRNSFPQCSRRVGSGDAITAVAIRQALEGHFSFMLCVYALAQLIYCFGMQTKTRLSCVLLEP